MILKLINKFTDWLTSADRELREAGYIVTYPPPGSGSFGFPYVQYVVPPKKHNINKKDNDRCRTIPKSNSRTKRQR